MRWPIAFAWVAVTVCTLAGASAQLRQTMPAYVEDSQEAQDQIAQAQDMRRAGRLGDAAERYQRIIETYPHKLVERTPGVYGDITAVLSARLMEDAELLAEYQRRFEPTAAGRLAQAGDRAALESVFTLYFATPSGLEAGLRLSGISLEEGRPNDASALLGRLGSHPALAARAARWNQLRAAAAVFTGDKAGAEAAVAELRRLGDGPAAAQAQALAAVRPAQSMVWDPARQSPAVTLPAKLGRPMWEVAVADPAPVTPGQRILGREIASFEPSPVGEGERLFLNRGREVLALDRTSGRPLWKYASPPQEQPDYNPWLRMASAERRGVTVEGGRVVSVMDAPPGNVQQYNPGPSPGVWLVCLSARDGKEIWRVTPRDLDDSLGSASFSGTPIAVDGRVYVVLRRTQMAGFQIVFVQALDAATGKPLWRRYLSSAPISQRRTVRPMAQMTLQGWRLLVADQLAAVTCLDARDGAVLWLHLLPAVDEIDARNGVMARPGRDMLQSPPVATAAGVIAGQLDSSLPPRLIDLETGRFIRALEGPGWGNADYFLPAGPDVLSIGAQVRLLDGATLAEKWSLQLGSPRGRAAVLDDQVVLPLGDKVVSLALADGKALWQQPVERAGSVLAMPDQIVFSDGTSVRGHMTWERAYARLKADVTAAPGDANPGLALAHLAMVSRQPEAALEGVDAALAAVAALPQGNDGSVRSQVFRQVLGFAESEGNDSALRYSLYDRLARVTSWPSEEVLFQLSRGVFLASMGNAAGAVDHFQAVLADPTLAQQLYRRGGAERRAEIEARTQLAAVIKQSGAKVYLRYEALAAQRLSELAPRGLDSVAPINAAALMELARQYPMATSAPTAVAASGEALAAGGDRAGALARLSSAYGMSRDPAQIARIVGRIVELQQALGRNRAARRWLEAVRREHPDVQPMRGGKPVTPDAWIAELAVMPGGKIDRPGFVGPITRVDVIQGRLLTPEAQDEDGWPRDRIVLWQPGQIEMRSGSDLSLKWSAALQDNGPVSLLRLSEEQVLVWLVNASRVVAYEAATGKEMWQRTLTHEEMKAVAAPERGREAEPAGAAEGQDPAGPPAEVRINVPARAVRQQALVVNGGRLIVINGRVIAQPGMGGLRVPQAQLDFTDSGSRVVRTNDQVVCVAEAGGLMAGVDRLTGKLLWRTKAPVDQLAVMEMGEEWIAVTGMAGLQGEAPSPVTLVLDPATGDVRRQIAEETQPPFWVGVTPDGGLVVRVAMGQATAHRISDGGLAWRVPLVAPEGGGVVCVEMLDSLLLVQESQTSIVAVEASTGQVLSRVSVPPLEMTGRVRMRLVDRLVHVLSPTSVTAVGLDGSLKWRDALGAQDKLFLLQQAGERTLAVLALVPPPAGEAAERNNQLQVMRMYIQQMDSRQQLRRAMSQRHMERDQAAAMLNQMAVLQPPTREGWYYRVYLFDRDTGLLTQSRTLGPVRDALDIDTSVMLDGRFVLTTETATIVLHGEAK
ncbi:MAG: PQQ-binding-like beta-propeller repeat protein [Planctomycetes bacterium]|nr:PQQ-binding-like beta-propeller repeat protein [Planctomycetota bacterium]